MNGITSSTTFRIIQVLHGNVVLQIELLLYFTCVSILFYSIILDVGQHTWYVYLILNHPNVLTCCWVIVKFALDLVPKGL